MKIDELLNNFKTSFDYHKHGNEYILHMPFIHKLGGESYLVSISESENDMIKISDHFQTIERLSELGNFTYLHNEKLNELCSIYGIENKEEELYVKIEKEYFESAIGIFIQFLFIVDFVFDDTNTENNEE